MAMTAARTKVLVRMNTIARAKLPKPPDTEMGLHCHISKSTAWSALNYLIKHEYIKMERDGNKVRYTIGGNSTEWQTTRGRKRKVLLTRPDGRRVPTISKVSVVTFCSPKLKQALGRIR